MDWNCVDGLELFFWRKAWMDWSCFFFLEKTMDGLELYGSIGFVFLGKSMDGGFAFSRRGKLDCGKPSAHRCQSQDNSRPKEKYCMANESGAHMARAEDFIFGEYVTRDKMWSQTLQGGGFFSPDWRVMCDMWFGK